MYNSKRQSKYLSKTFRICVVSYAHPLAKHLTTPPQSPSTHLQSIAQQEYNICQFPVSLMNIRKCNIKPTHVKSWRMVADRVFPKISVIITQCQNFSQIISTSLTLPVYLTGVIWYESTLGNKEYFFPTTKFPRWEWWVF